MGQRHSYGEISRLPIPINKPVKFIRLFSDRVPRSLIDCIEDLLRYEPSARLNSKQCLQHEYMTTIAPRLRPPQAKPVVSAKAPLRPQQPMVAGANASRPVPPSHSTPLSGHVAKPPFGAADANLKQIAMLRQSDGSKMVIMNGTRPPVHVIAPDSSSPTVASGSPASPMQEDGAEVHWAPHAGSSNRVVSLSGYPAFPDSASAHDQSISAHHEGSSTVAPSSDATVVLGNGSMAQSNGQATDATLQHADYRHGQALQAHQYEQYQRQYRQDASQQQRMGYEQDAAAAYERDQAARSGAFVPYAGGYPHSGSQGPLPGAASSGDLSQRNDSNASNETIGSRDKDKRKSKTWGLNISSVFGGSGSSGTASGGGQGSGTPHQYAMANASASRLASNGIAGGNMAGNGSMPHVATEPTPAQRIAAEHSNAPGQANGMPNKAPLDPKKAKKEAEKAAREAEKARREAQQKAARDRARAVMQKRNQLLASSNSKDPVEWLAGTIQADEPYRSSPSEKARGKQPAAPGSQLSPSMPSFASSEFPRSPLQPPTHGLSPDYGMTAHAAVTGNMAWRGVGAGRYSRSNKARRREHDDDHSMSSFEDAVDPRRASMQSYQTGDSDPGPGTGQHMPQGHHIQRASSSSSLASAPSLLDQRRFAPSLESHRSSQETRSISSLDHQLITNMENMTAAEARTRTPGNVSPGPPHVVGTRQSVSRQSRTNSRASSASAHRQGSASPLHHASGIPRFHPYSHGGPVTPSTGYHPNYQLPPLHQSLQQGSHRGEPGSEGVISQGYHVNQGHPQHHPHSHHINPIFHVPAGNAGHGTTLPPFSSIAASLDVAAIDDKTPQMMYAQPRSSGPLPQT